MARTVKLATDECIGCGSCAEICPAVFGFDEEAGKAFVHQENGGDLECAGEAAAACPVSCITVA